MKPPTVEWMLDATEKERRAAFATVTDLIKAAGWWLEDEAAAAHILAVLGCAPTAKRAATALRRIPGVWWQVDLEAVSRLVRKRSQPWFGDLAAVLAERLEVASWDGHWRVVEVLVSESGIPVPTSAGFVAGWISARRRDPDLRESPYTATLLPKVFEHDGLGGLLARESFATPVLLWAGDDPVRRGMLIGGCLSRLLRGGRDGDLRAFVAFYETLAPKATELTGHVPDLLGLLGSTHTGVAALGQKTLRQLDESGLIDVETVLEAGVLALQRTEKGLLKAQGVWLRRSAKRHPGRAADLLGLLEVPDAPPPEVIAFTPPVSPALPSPPGTPAELAEQLAALIAGDWSVPTSESVLAGLITLRAKDHQALQDALAPVVQAHWETLQRVDSPMIGALTAALATTVSMADSARALHDLVTGLELKLRFGEPLAKLSQHSAGLGAFFEHRLAEIAAEASRSPRPYLFATPSQANGHIEAELLLRRMEEAELEGWQPWPIDFAQSILRVPREPAPKLADRAARLRSPMGERLAARLRDGHHDPVCTPFVQRVRRTGRRDFWFGDVPEIRKVVAVEPAGEVGPFERALFTLKPAETPQGGVWWGEQLTEIGAGTLPSHREVAAARMLSSLAEQADSDRGRGVARIMPTLAECHGPIGVATALAIAYALTAKETTDRIAGVDALIGFGPALDAELVGAELAEACAAGVLALSRAVMALGQATTSGGAEVVWRVCRGALPGLLALEKARPGTPDLLALACDCAKALGVRGDLPGLQAVAGRPGTSRLATEAQRLLAILRG